MKKPLVIGIALWFAISLAMFFAARSTDSQSVIASLANIRQQVADDEAKQYWIARRNAIGHDARDAYYHATFAAEAYLQAGDEENYRKWKRIARDLPASEEVFTAQQNAKAQQQLDRPPPAPATPQKTSAEYQAEYTAREDALQAQRVSEAMEASRLAGIKQRAEEAKQKIVRDAADGASQTAIDARAAHEKKQKFLDAIASNQLRPWKTLGGKEASRAKIVGYDNGVFTLEKADGKTIELRKSRMSKADVEYCDNWLESAGNP